MADAASRIRPNPSQETTEVRRTVASTPRISAPSAPRMARGPTRRRPGRPSPCPAERYVRRRVRRRAWPGPGRVGPSEGPSGVVVGVVVGVVIGVVGASGWDVQDVRFAFDDSRGSDGDTRHDHACRRVRDAGPGACASFWVRGAIHWYEGPAAGAALETPCAGANSNDPNRSCVPYS